MTNINTQERIKKKQLSALKKITARYVHIIIGDEIILRYVRHLLLHIITTNPGADRLCKTLINYLLTEIHSPLYKKLDANKEVDPINDNRIELCHKDYFRFLYAIEDFYEGYIK